jgi:single-strand DNA-binding protein
MNKVIMMGRLTKDPDITNTTNGTVIAKYNIAVDRKFKRDGDPDADFFSCTSFGKQAEFVEKYLKKGTKVVITGRVQNNNYTDKNGQKVYGTVLMVEEIEFAESKKAEGTNEEKQDDFINVPDDSDLPF